METTKLTTTPQGIEFYKVCDQEGVCHEVRGISAAQHPTEDGIAVTPAKTKYTDDWV